MIIHPIMRYFKISIENLVHFRDLWSSIVFFFSLVENSMNKIIFLQINIGECTNY